MGGVERIRAWDPGVPGVAEVLHGTFTDHAYPAHTHDTWTVLVVDAGTVRYDLGRHERATAHRAVTVLPPHVAHDGRAARAGGFRKRVLYLDADALDVRRTGAWVDEPEVADPALLRLVDGLHRLAADGAADSRFGAECALSLVRERLDLRAARLRPPTTGRAPTLARRLRDLLDDHLVPGLTLADAARTLGADPAHLVRAFRAETGVTPHRYLIGRRVDAARRALLAGVPPAQVAAEVGFYDQAHLNRHFRAVLGVAPGAFARSA